MDATLAVESDRLGWNRHPGANNAGHPPVWMKTTSSPNRPSAAWPSSPAHPLPRVGAIEHPAAVARRPADGGVAGGGRARRSRRPSIGCRPRRPRRATIAVEPISVERVGRRARRCRARPRLTPLATPIASTSGTRRPPCARQRPTGDQPGVGAAARRREHDATGRDARRLELVEQLDERRRVAERARRRCCPPIGIEYGAQRRRRRAASVSDSRAISSSPQWLSAAPVKCSWAPNSIDSNWLPVTSPGRRRTARGAPRARARHRRLRSSGSGSTGRRRPSPAPALPRPAPRRTGTRACGPCCRHRRARVRSSRLTQAGSSVEDRTRFERRRQRGEPSSFEMIEHNLSC